MIEELQKDFDELVGKRRKIEVFTDFCTIFANMIRNQVDGNGWEQREEQYLRLIKEYDADVIAGIMAKIVMELENEPKDILGEMYMSNDSAIKSLGQFFTPSDLSDLLAKMTYDSELTKQAIDDKGYITVDEPSIGGGVFLMSFIKRMWLDGYNPQTQLYVTGTDIDRTAVNMAYIHLTLVGVPATIVHGNTLTKEVWDVWHTPACYRVENRRKIRGKGVGVSE